MTVMVFLITLATKLAEKWNFKPRRIIVWNSLGNIGMNFLWTVKALITISESRKNSKRREKNSNKTPMFGQQRRSNGKQTSRLIKCKNASRQKSKKPSMSNKSADMKNSRPELTVRRSMKCALNFIKRTWKRLLKPAEVMGLPLLNPDLANL